MIIRKKVVEKKISELEEQQPAQYQNDVQPEEYAQNLDENPENYENAQADEDYDYPDTNEDEYSEQDEYVEQEEYVQDEYPQEDYSPEEQYQPNYEEEQPVEQEYENQAMEQIPPQEYTPQPELQEQNLESNLTPEEYSEPQHFEQLPDVHEEIEQAEIPQQEQEEMSQQAPPKPQRRRIKEKEKVKKQPMSLADEEINLFDLDNIDFSQREERRRGDRRRGFRRVDDRNLVSRAREEADAIREAARNEGYQAGWDEAQEDLEIFKSSLSEFMNAKQEVFEYIAPDILEISVDIAQKIIKKEVEQSPQVLFNTIVDVLKTLSKEEAKVTLRVNPIEVNQTKEMIPQLINLAGMDTKIVVLSDENVTEGGCLITTTNGIVDATIESRLRVVMQALREM